MSWWLLMLVGLCIPDWTITINDREFNIDTFLRLIVFICCCIWG